jgi:hypothetical protein
MLQTLASKLFYFEELKDWETWIVSIASIYLTSPTLLARSHRWFVRDAVPKSVEGRIPSGQIGSIVKGQYYVTGLAFQVLCKAE